MQTHLLLFLDPNTFHVVFKIQTHLISCFFKIQIRKRLRRTLFILTKYNMRMLGYYPYSSYKTTLKTMKKKKKKKEMFWVDLFCCVDLYLEECWHRMWVSFSARLVQLQRERERFVCDSWTLHRAGKTEYGVISNGNTVGLY